jgi:hypothetical protein
MMAGPFDPYDESALPGLGDLFADPDIMRPVPGPIGTSEDIIQPMGLMGVMPPIRPTVLPDVMAAAIPMPAIHTGGDQALVNKIYEHAEQNRSPVYPMAKEPLFNVSGDVAKQTKELVPQTSIAAQLPPTPPPDQPFPLNDRMRLLYENNEKIARRLADMLEGVPAMPFYSTGPVLQGFSDIGGLSIPDAVGNLREWAGSGAATSPRTQTPPNLRNSSYLLNRRAAGDPLTPERQLEEQAAGKYGYDKKGKPLLNRPGFPMMGMHTTLADEFARGTADPWKNPKPYTFRENWTGNMADVTADTHNIRAVLDAYDQIAPGTLPREWFKNDASYRTYVEGGGFPKEGALPVGGIRDTLGGAMISGQREAQTEYPLIQRPTTRAAELLGISPAEAQERLWFGAGSRTNLSSPSMTIPDLFNAQIEQTANVTGLKPEAVLKLWLQRRIPFAANEPETEMPGASMVG